MSRSSQTATFLVGTVDVAGTPICDTPAVDASPVRVAILDDHKMVLAGLAAWLEAASSDVEVVIKAVTWADLLAHPAFPVDVVLLDLDLGDGIPAPIKIVALKSSGVSVVIVSALSDELRVRECYSAGALSYLPKSEPEGEIINAIKAAAAGEDYMTPALAKIVLNDNAINRPKLSPREREVLREYASGLPMKSVARRMMITSDTAKGYIDRVRDKYEESGREARTKIELRRRAIEDGIIPGD